MTRFVTMPVLAISFALTLPVYAQNAGEVRFFGYSEVSCGSWTAERQAKSTNSYLFRAWVTGFVSAYDAFAPKAEGHQPQTDVDGMTGWIDNYCKANPLKNLLDATAAMIREFQKR